jgi:2'-5' RNA ligase
VAYPKLESQDYKIIQEIRQKFDPHFKFIEPHFTFVFSVFEFEPDILVAEIKNLVKTTAVIDFTINSASISFDKNNQTYYSLLTTSQNSSQITELYSLLHSNLLKKCINENYTFTPHITIGSNLDSNIIQKICEDFSKKNLIINGNIETLSIITIENNFAKTLVEINLKNLLKIRPCSISLKLVRKKVCLANNTLQI